MYRFCITVQNLTNIYFRQYFYPKNYADLNCEKFLSYKNPSKKVKLS